MTTTKDLLIEEFFKGIADSPHLGFSDMRNLDTSSVPGILQPNYATSKKSSTTVTDLIKWFAVNPTNGHIFALGDTGKVYTSSDGGGTWSLIAGNTTTNADGDGLAIWKDYLFVCRNTNIDVYGPLSSSPSWTNGWQTTLTASGTSSVDAFHPMLVGQDDILYIGNQRYIASIQELTTFAPGTGSSYSFTANALDLPAGYKVKCLAELGTKLMIGTWKGTAIYDVQVADIFPWDRVSSSFDLPIRLSTYGVHGLVNVNNLLYILAGIHGNIYVSNGTTTRLLRHLPDYLTGLQGGIYATFYPGAIINHNGKIHFGLSQGTSGHTNDVFGVWSVTPNGTLAFEHQISTGTVDFTNSAYIGALLPSAGGTYLIGWQDNATYGVDQTGTSTRYTSYAAVVQTPLYRVGTPLQKKQFTQVEFVLDKPLASGDGVKVKYRTNLTDAFTTLGTYDFATYGAVDTLNAPFPHPACVNLQLQIELTQNARLREFRVR